MEIKCVKKIDEGDKHEKIGVPFKTLIDIGKSIDNKIELNWINILNIFIIRFMLAITCMERVYHPDENM